VTEAAGALMNLALKSAATQDEVVKQGALPLLVELLSVGSPSAQEEAAGALMNLVTDAPKLQKAVADAGAVLPLVMLLNWGTSGAKEQAAGALNKLASKNDDNRAAIVDAQAVPALLAIIAAPADGKKPAAGKDGKTASKTAGKEEAASCLATLLEGDVPLQAVLVEDGGLPTLASLLKDKATAEAGSKVLAVFSECFEDQIDSAKGK